MKWLRVFGVIMGVACLGVASPTRLAEPGQIPPRTVLLSQMMRQLSAEPGFTEELVRQMQVQSKVGAAMLTPKLVDHLREMILGKDWAGLDRFPGWSMREINPTVRVVGHVAGKDADATTLARNPGSTTVGAMKPSKAGSPEMSAFVDFGEYRLETPHAENLDRASERPRFSERGLVNAVGDGVVRGDGPDERLAPMHAESTRLAEVLNRLSLNDLDGAKRMAVEVAGIGSAVQQSLGTPEDLMQALIEGGHEVVVSDSRYFANFGHFHYNGQDVMMPFWVNSQILVPGTARPLLVPVSHAEYEWQVRGPRINAAVSFYFGIDGKAEFRTMDQLDQAWVMNRHAHEYRGAEAVEVTRLAGRMLLAYAHQHQQRPKLPFGGYYALGVCQDVVAAIELKMTGRATLFPNTADGALFNDPRDAEINGLIRAIPKDRDGKMPGVERIFGSLPTDDLEGVTIPGLGPDLVAVHRAWTNGTLERTGIGWRRRALAIALFGAGMLVLFRTVRRASRRARQIR